MASEISGVLSASSGAMSQAVRHSAGGADGVAAPRPGLVVSTQVQANLAVSRYAQAQELREGLNRAAAAVRDSYRALDAIDQKLGEMGASLAIIIKQYPPYPIDNPERIELLNRFSELRKQIDALTFPPPERWQQAALLADPARFSQAGDLELVTPEGETERVRAQPAHAGPGGLGLPDLDPGSVDDAEVIIAAESVEQAKKQVELKKAGMWDDVVKIADKIDVATARQRAEESGQAAARHEFQAIGADRSVLAQA